MSAQSQNGRNLECLGSQNCAGDDSQLRFLSEVARSYLQRPMSGKDSWESSEWRTLIDKLNWMFHPSFQKKERSPHMTKSFSHFGHDFEVCLFCWHAHRWSLGHRGANNHLRSCNEGVFSFEGVRITARVPFYRVEEHLQHYSWKTAKRSAQSWIIIFIARPHDHYCLHSYWPY